jgi:hypothetical protein
MNKPNFHECAYTAQQNREKAIAFATERMKAEGHFYPIHCGQPPSEFMNELDAYREKESRYIVEFMRQPSGPRPLEIDNVKPLKPVNQWGRPYYDD